MKISRVAVALGLLAPILLHSAAFADSQWSQPVQLSAKSSGTYDAQFLLAPDGRAALAVWLDRKQEQSTLVARLGAVMSTGVKWANTVSLAPAARFPVAFTVAWSADGKTVAVAWQDCKTSEVVSMKPCWLQARVGRYAEGSISWGRVDEFRARDLTVSDPEIALSRDGSRISAIWVDMNAGTSEIGYASGTVTNDGISWSPIQTLASTTNGSNLPNGSSFSQSGLTLSADGDLATVVWLRSFERDGRGVVETRSGTRTGQDMSWAPVQSLSPETGFASQPAIRASADGRRLLAAWYVGEGYREVVAIDSARASVAGATATWSALGGPAPRSGSLPLVAFNVFDAIEGPQLVMSRDGRRAAAAWIRKNISQVLPQYAIIDLQSEGSTWTSPNQIVPLAPRARTIGGIRLVASEDALLFKAVWQDGAGYPTSREGRLEGNAISWVRSGSVPGFTEATQLVGSSDGQVTLVSSWNSEYDGLRVASSIRVTEVAQLPKVGTRCKTNEGGKVVMRGGQSRECLPDRNGGTFLFWYPTVRALPSPGKALIADWDGYQPPVGTFDSIASCRASGTEWEFVVRWKLSGGNSIQSLSEPVDVTKPFSQMKYISKYVQVDSQRSAFKYSLIVSKEPFLTWRSLEVGGLSVPFNYKELGNAPSSRAWGTAWVTGPTEPGPNPWTPIVLGSAAACKK